ncbi:uncharacterized protein LOC132703511 [Cylas formicarius]|uniref:uncharacterized protein LOC132703511 n=1 Tax=Cylas formicarius TaxID=197179 RepID=UPI002958A23E|nr:uncharacterized protein LOC132703511 [Cylas formicarius]
MTKECENILFSTRGVRNDIDIYPQKRKRDPNFSTNEIQLLVSIVSKYAHITEDKKTDRSSVETKNKVWKTIEKEFNASNSEGLFRNAQKLKKCFENRKHEIRVMEIEKSKRKYLGSKAFFEEENNLIKNGASDEKEYIQPSSLESHYLEKRDGSEEMKLSTMNDKSLYSLEFNGFDSRRTDPLRKGEDNMEYMYDSENTQGNEIESSNYKLSDVGSSDIEYACECELNTNMEEEHSSGGKHSCPCIKCHKFILPKFQEKYDKLLDKRLALIANQIEDFEEERDFRKKERKLKLQLLHLQIAALKK